MSMTRLQFFKGLFCLPALVLLPKPADNSYEAYAKVARKARVANAMNNPLNGKWKWIHINDVPAGTKIGNFCGTFEIFPKPDPDIHRKIKMSPEEWKSLDEYVQNLIQC